MLPDTLNRRPLLLHPGTSRPIRLARARPPGLQIIRLQTGTDALQQGQLLRHERARPLGGDIGVEKRMDVRGRDVERGTERGGVLLEDIDRFGGRDGPSVARGAEGGFGFVDEGREGGGGAVAVEDGLVADDDQFDGLPVRAAGGGPGGDFVELGFGVGDAGFGDEDAEDEVQAVGGGGGADGGEARAVGAVEPDGAEAFGGDGGDVAGDG